MKQRRHYIASGCRVGMAAANSTQLTFRVQATVPAGVGNHAYIDLAGLLSAQNKRLYRQGMVYHARVSTTNFNAAGGVSRDIAVLHNSWRIRKAWAQAKKAFDMSNADERAAGARRGRWNDFKVFYEDTHNAGNTFGPTTASDGEWNYTVANAATTSAQYQFHMLGAGSGGSPGRFGILREYDEMRDQDTDTPAAAGNLIPFSVLHAGLSNNQGDLIQEEGDLPPYGAADLERETPEVIYRLGVPNTPDNLVQSTQGFIPIPCGLIKLETSSLSGDDLQYELRIDFKAGSYKGVHAEAMA